MDGFRKSTDEQRADITRRVWAIVNALPQRAAIREEDAAAWIDAVVGAHGEAAIWHATRLGGFGGSEIGALVRNYQGERADHGLSARDIVELKLMRRAPLEDTAHLRRGRENEQFHAQRFWDKWGAQRDRDAYDKLKNAKGWLHPWMRYSPDDVVRMPLKVVGQGDEMRIVRTREPESLWLVDYKAPAQVEQAEKVAFQYAAQLHQGAILCAEAGLELDGMMLSQFDWANWTLKDDVVTWDPHLGQTILEAGDHYWEFVERGELPPYVVRPLWDGSSSYIESMGDAARQYAALAALADVAKERAEAIRQQLLQPLADVRLGSSRIDFFDDQNGQKLLTVTTNKLLDKELVAKSFSPEQLAACEKGETELDANAMASYLKELGVDMAQFRRRRLDADKVFALAAKLGMDPERLVREQFVLRVASHVKDAMRDYLAEAYPETPSAAAELQDEAESMRPST